MGIAILILTFIVGVSVVNVFFNRLARFLISLVVVGLVFVALIRGESPWIENFTANLARYFAAEPVGLVGFLVGVLVGSAFRRRKK